MKAICIVLLCLAALGFTQTVTPEKKIFLMFFMKGEGKRPDDKGELEKMQAAHLANMGEQYNKHHLLAAGPLQDPAKERRGITIVHVENEADVPALFKNDPYVAHDIMGISLMEWKISPDSFKRASVDPEAIVPFRLVLFTQGKSLRPVNAQIMKEHLDYIASLKQTHGLGVHGEIRSAKKVREAAIFSGEDTKGIETALSQDPLVRASLLEVEIIPLWMSKGILGP
ncbi:MAG: YciI family protein [Fimbriimonadaceae bacterium]